MKNALILLIFIFLSLGSLYALERKITKPSLNLTAEEMRSNLSGTFFNLFHLGQKRLLTSVMWIETLLNADHEDFVEDEGHSWLYYRFRNITLLDPYFYEAWSVGTQYLHVLKGEFEPAINYARDGLAFFPEDYWLHYHIAMIHIIELDRDQEALPYLDFLINHPRSHRHPAIHGIYYKILENENPKNEILQAIQQIYEELPEENPLKEHYRNLMKRYLTN